MFARFDEIPLMTPRYKSHSELQREITPVVLAPSPYIFISSICLVYMNVFAKFDEIPSMILEVIKETKRFGHTVGWTFGRENSIPSHKHSLRGGIKRRDSCHNYQVPCLQLQMTLLVILPLLSKGTFYFNFECVNLLQNDFCIRYITLNASISGQDRIYPKTHLCRTFFC